MFRLAVLVGAFAFLFIEITQLKSSGFSYFTDLWNWVYWFSNSIAIIIVIDHGITQNFDLKTLIELGSLSIVG